MINKLPGKKITSIVAHDPPKIEKALIISGNNNPKIALNNNITVVKTACSHGLLYLFNLKSEVNISLLQGWTFSGRHVNILNDIANRPTIINISLEPGSAGLYIINLGVFYKNEI